jgi:hypothetical protein
MKSVLKSFVVSFAIAGVAGIVYGIPVGPFLSISDGVDPTITIFDNVAGDLNPATGILTLSTNVGVWSLSVSTGITKPAMGSTTNPIMDLVIQATSTGAGTLTYTFADLGFTKSGPLSSTISGHVISGLPTTVNYKVFGDASNTVGALTTQLTTTGTLPLPVLTSNFGTLPSSGLYSLSQVVQLNASGASSVSVDASLSVVPEPSTVTLTFLGLASLVAGLAQRRRSLRSTS